MSYTDTVKAAKLAARDVLRAAQIERRLETIHSLNISLKNADKEIEEIRKYASDNLIEANALAEGLSYKAARVESATKQQENANKQIEGIEKEKEATQKQLETVNTEIAEIESGKKKVDFEPMVKLAKEFVKERYQEAFVAGEYDAEAKKADKSNN